MKCIFDQINLFIMLALLFGIENRRSLLIVHKRICRKLSSSLISAAMFTRNCLLTDPVRNKTKRTDQTEPMVTFFAGLILHSSKTFFWTDWLSVKTTTYFRLGFDKSSSNTLTNKLSSFLTSHAMPLMVRTPKHCHWDSVSSCERSMLHTAWLTYFL